MRMTRNILAGACLLALAASGSAQALIIQAGPEVEVGEVLYFSARLSYELAGCTPPHGNDVIEWYVACENHPGWGTECYSPMPDSTLVLDYDVTYTVTLDDARRQELCFMLYARSNCWDAPRPVPSSRQCLRVKPAFQLPHFELQRVLECEILPSCPLCALLDLSGLMDSVGNPAERVQVQLLHGEEQVAVLGTAGPKQKLPAKLQVTLPEAKAGLKHGARLAGYALRAVDGRGKELVFQKITIRVK